MIKILSDRDHVLKRPAMYIGSTVKEPHERFLNGSYTSIEYVPGLLKIISEVIDNSIDEAIRTNFEYANKISVSMTSDSVTIEDNGRGIPLKEVQTPEGDSIPGPVAAWTRTKAGSNFGDDSTRTTIGMNGVGSSLTNIFSKSFIGATCDGVKKLVLTCSDNLEHIDWKISNSKKQGTTVTFVPDFSVFGVDTLEAETPIVKDLVQTLAVIYPEILFKFNGDIVQGNFKKFAKLFGEPIIVDSPKCSLALCTSPDGFRQLSYVNGVHTKNGGTHVEYINDGIVEQLIPAIKKKYKIDVNKARIKECLTMVLFIRDMPNMRFDSQTKERLTSPYSEIKSHIDLDIDKLVKQILRTDSVLMPIIESALARKLAAEKAAETKALKNAKKARVAKHIKANKAGDSNFETTLFITEGDSAIGYLLATRNKDLHGGYPLRGKVMNTWGMSAGEMLKNKEIFELCGLSGLVLGKPLAELDLAYTNFAIMCDADVDGQGSITPALLTFFSNWPELFDQGRIRIVKTPIIIAQKGNDEQWFYSIEEFEQSNLSGYKTRYLKGLGSLERYQYSRVINNPVYDIISLDDNWKDLLEMLFGNNAELRKEWMK